MNKNIFAILLQIIGAVFITIIGIVSSIVKFIFGRVADNSKNKQMNDAIKHIEIIRKTIEYSVEQNNHLLFLSKQAYEAVDVKSSDKIKLNDHIRYCQKIKEDLDMASTDISNDINKQGNDGFVFYSSKYESILNKIRNIKYPFSEEQLKNILVQNEGLARYIDNILAYAKVENIIRIENVWSYYCDGIDFTLTLSRNEEDIHIVAKSLYPSKYEGHNGVKRVIDQSSVIRFDDNNELSMCNYCKSTNIDHYDVFEYFSNIQKILQKKEINEYAGKYKLSIIDAFDIEDNVSQVFCNLKKTAPPPVDYIPDEEKMHGGKQRWAQFEDVSKANMLEDKGFLIGKMGYGSMLYTGEYDSHILTIASTGSGKGVGVIVPNLLRHKGSAIVLDPKGENFIVTSKKRQENGSAIFYFDPWDMISKQAQKTNNYNCSHGTKARINPLDLIDSNSTSILFYANSIASSLIMRESDKDAYFYDGAELLLTRVIIYICTKYEIGSERRNLYEVRRLITADKDFLLKSLKKECENPNAHIVTRELYSWLDEIIRTKNKGANDIYQFAQNATSFMMDEQVRESLMDSNIDIMSLKTINLSLYLIFDMHKLTFNANYYKPLIRLIVTTCMLGLTVSKKPENKVLFLLDEIAQLGTLQCLTSLLTLYRSEHVVVWTIWQNLSQIKELYEKQWQTIIGNCYVKQFFGVNDSETAEYVSSLAGATTIYEESINSNTSRSSNTTDTETRGDQNSYGVTEGVSKNSGHSYQGFNYSYNTGSSTSDSVTNNYTNSYGFSRAIQIGFSETEGRNLAKKTAPLITPYEVMLGNNYDVQFVFFTEKCPYPILSSKIKYYEDLDFYGEYSNNITRQ